MITLLNVNITETLKGRIDAQAEFEGRDRSSMVRWMIVEYLRKQDVQVKENFDDKEEDKNILGVNEVEEARLKIVKSCDCVCPDCYYKVIKEWIP